MQASRQVPSNDFVYLLHAAVPPATPAPRVNEVIDDETDEQDEELDDDDDGGLKEVNFDD
jgi:hypothetical protein